MLTLAQFKQKHAKKFAGLSDQEVQMRYRDYKSSSVTAKNGGGNIKSRVVRNMNKQTVFTNVPVLSECSQLYARALVNPFEGFPHYPCIPDVINLPSYKFAVKARGNFVIGTAGVGYVSLSPFTAANDVLFGTATTAAFIAPSYQTPVTLGLNSFFSDSQFTQADLAGCEVRVVGAGIQARFQGSEFNRGGVVLLHRSPLNTQIPAGANEAILLLNRTTVQAVATRNVESVTYRPDNPLFLGYGPASSLGNQTLMIYASGAIPGQTWSFESIVYFELIGNRGNPTASHSDPVGMGAVIGAMPVINSTLPPKQQESNVIAFAKKAVAYATSGIQVKELLTNVVSTGLGALGTYLGGPVGGTAGAALGKAMMGGPPLNSVFNENTIPNE